MHRVRRELQSAVGVEQLDGPHETGDSTGDEIVVVEAHAGHALRYRVRQAQVVYHHGFCCEARLAPQ